MSRLSAAASKIYGPPPPKGAPPSQRLRYVRRMYWRMLLFALPLYAILTISAEPAWVLVPAAVGTLIWLQGFASLSVRIRREQRRER
jgi:hypothetical protein